MTLYPPLESGETHRLQHVAEVRFRLEEERHFRASLYKKYRRGANFVDGLDTALSVTSVGLAATGVGLLSTIIAVPVALGLQDGAIVCWLLGAGGKLVGLRLQAKARKDDLILGLAESKINTIADRISTVLTDDKITEEEFCLILSEFDKYNQLKAGIRSKAMACQKMKTQAISVCERRSDDDSPREVVERGPPSWKHWNISINVSCSRA